MTQEERIQAFELLGKSLDDQPANEFQSLAENVRQENPWFTEANVRMAVNGVRKLLQSDGLRKWVANYDLAMEPKVIAVVMAGNIPMVGFHDLLCVLICGHSILIKCSSKDTELMKFITTRLVEIELFPGPVIAEDQLGHEWFPDNLSPAPSLGSCRSR